MPGQNKPGGLFRPQFSDNCGPDTKRRSFLPGGLRIQWEEQRLPPYSKEAAAQSRAEPPQRATQTPTARVIAWQTSSFNSKQPERTYGASLARSSRICNKASCPSK